MVNVGDTYTAQELATYLRINRQAVYRLIRKGELPAEKTDGLLRVAIVAAERWLDEKTRPDF